MGDEIAFGMVQASQEHNLHPMAQVSTSHVCGAQKGSPLRYLGAYLHARWVLGPANSSWGAH